MRLAMAMQYLPQLDALPAERQWERVRHYLFAEPLPFLAELRRNRPVMILPEMVIATRFADCSMILRRHQTFGVDLYKPKQGGYFMAQDDTAVHWREKSIMKSVLDREDIPKIRAWVEETTDAALKRGKGQIDLVPDVSRKVPIALVQEWFGFSGANPKKLQEWSYWNQQDAFWNQPFDAVAGHDQQQIVRNREKANVELAIYLGALVARRALAARLWSTRNDVVSRLVRLSLSKSTRFSIKDAVVNVGGLLIGAVETTSHAVVNALQVLLERPDVLPAAKAAALSRDVEAFDGYVFEALRFKPAFPYFFRTCHRETTLGVGTGGETTIRPGTTVLAVTHSAMFDELNFPSPDMFDPRRDLSDTFTFGQGLHECLGIAIARVMVPEVVRQVLRRPNLVAAGSPDYKGTGVPEHWHLTYG
jgi:cytochrome P450